jgi:hypothetical protein
MNLECSLCVLFAWLVGINGLNKFFFGTHLCNLITWVLQIALLDDRHELQLADINRM